MKIHTTQNLNSLRGLKSTNDSAIPSEEIRLNYSEQMRKLGSSILSTQENDSVSFKGKKEFVKKAADNINKKVADKEKWYYGFLKSGFFDKALDLMSHEVFIQAAISAIICCIARPLTIMALPAKDKDNNKYASAHSISSGVVGVAASLLISVPFSKGVRYAQKNLLHNLDVKHLKKMFPHLEEKSVIGKNNIRKPMEEWLDKFGNKFSTETKDVMMAAKPRSIEHISETTLLKDFGLNIDTKAMAGKRISEWTTRSGEKLKFQPKDMFIEIKEEGMGSNYFSLGLADKKFLGETFEKLDINTIEKSGKRINPLEWKNKDGSEFMPDLLDHVYLSSWKETHEAIPLYSGLKRTETTGKKEVKYCAYQRNIKDYDASKVPEKLGTTIDQDMLNADSNNTILYKLLIWLPDIVTRPVVAASTIALIPFVLKKVFGLEKKKKPENVIAQQNNQIDITKTEPQALRKAVA